MSIDQSEGSERERAEQQHRADARARITAARAREAEVREVRRRNRQAAQEARTPPMPATASAPEDVTDEAPLSNASGGDAR